MTSLSAIAQLLGSELVDQAPLAGGVSARVLLLTLRDGRELVYREGQAQPGKPAADEMTSEFRLLEWLYDREAPVPRPVRLADDGRWFMMDRAPGRAASEADIDAMAAFLAWLHDQPVECAPALPERESPAEMLQWLPPEHPLQADPARLRAGESRCVLHGDFWPGNVLVEDGAITAVIDWEDAAVGDPVCDLAGARVEWVWAHGEDAADRFTAAYTARRGPVDPHQLAVWEAFVASAGLAYMGGWGLEPAREARMRRRGEGVLARAVAVITGA